MTNAMPTEGSHVDIVALVEADHRVVRAMVTRMNASGSAERAELWPQLMRALVAHEVAEEQVVFPGIRSVATDAGPVLDARLAEQAEAEETLKRLEDLDPASDQFAEVVTTLGRSVLAHAAAEEREVLPLLVHFEKALDRPGMGVRYENAKRRAPTHPHPHAPDRAPANMVLGPVTALFDRLRDRTG